MGKTVVLFGASGFLGRNLALHLEAKGHDVIGVSRTGTPVPGTLAAHSIEDLADMKALGTDAVVVHIAAHRYEAKNFSTGQSDILFHNTRLSNQIYQFCTERKVREVRAASSVAVYPASLSVMDDETPVDLNAPPHPREAFYAWSKRWGEILARLYHDRYGVNTLSFRLSNPYGPFDSINLSQAHVLPAFVLKALSDNPVFEIMGDPLTSRDFVFVEDVCEVFCRSLAWEGEPETFNLCSGEQTTLLALAQAIMRAACVDKVVKVIGDETHGVARRISKATRVKAAFGLVSFTPLDVGLHKTIDWYRHAIR